MWQPVKIVLNNWLSFQDEEYSFVNNTPYLIQGVNLTDDSTESNGSGKSSFEEAMNYLLLGQSIRKVRDNELIMHEEDSAKIYGEFVNIRDNSLLAIERTVFGKKSAKLSITLNDKEQQFASIEAGNKLLLSIIGISNEDIQNYFIINKEKYVSFFKSSDNDKKQLIARFSNVDKIDGIEKLIEEDIKNLDLKVSNFNDKKNRLQGKIETYKEELESQPDPESLKGDKIKQLEDKIQTYRSKISQDNLEIDRKKAYIQSINDIIYSYDSSSTMLKKELEELKTINLDADFTRLQKEEDVLNKSKQQLREERKQVEENISETNSLLKELETTVKSSIKCPKCLHEFIFGNEEVSVEEARNSIPEVKQLLTELSSNVNKTLLSIKELDTRITKINSERSALDGELTKFRNHKKKLEDQIIQADQEKNKQLNEIKKCENTISTLQQAISEHNKMITTFEDQIKEVHKMEIESRKSEIENKIVELEPQIQEIDSEVQIINDERLELRKWQEYFKRFYSYMTNQSLSVIQGYANLYLQRMGTNLQVRMDGVKVLSDGRLKENITAQILRNGIVEGSFWKLSGGEKARIEFSIIMAIQSLINTTTKTGGLNLCWIDEILESIDGTGIRSLIDSMKSCHKTILLTTHVNHDKIHSNSIIIEKVNGVSKIRK